VERQDEKADPDPRIGLLVLRRHMVNAFA
jgi:hypothetical protein